MNEEKKYSEREFEIGRLAAYIDGEGTIGIARRKPWIEKRTGKRRRVSFSLRVSVANTDLILIEWLCQKFGGTFVKKRARNDRCKAEAEWVICGRNAFKLLREMNPFLIIKGERADVGIEFWEKCSMKTTIRNRGGWREDRMIQKQKEYYERMKMLNKKGPQQVEGEINGADAKCQFNTCINQWG